MEWTKEEAKAADKVLGELVQAYYVADDRYDRASNSVHRAADDEYRRKYDPKSGWKLSVAEAVVKAQELAEKAQEGAPWRAKEIQRALESYEAAKADRSAADKAIDVHEEAYYKGWPRFFMVLDGHIHRSRSCHSLRITTRISWLPDLSGETIAEAVAEYGTLLCTHCFPEAPVEWTVGKKPKIAEGHCTGQGKVAQDISWRYRSGVGTCVECSQPVSVSSLGKALKHKLPK